MKLINQFKIANKQGRAVKFNFNKPQEELVNIISQFRENSKRVRIIVVKGRQEGVSALLTRLGLSKAMTQKDYKAYIIAHDSSSAKDLFQNHVKYSFESLPNTFKNLYKTNRDNSNEIRFENPEVFNSFIKVTSSARSGTANWLHISEAGKIAKDQRKWRELITGSLPAAEFGDIIIESTAEGFTDFYKFTMEKLNDPSWAVVFLHWSLASEYSIEPPKDNKGWREELNSLLKRYKISDKFIDDYSLNDNQLYWYLQKVKDLKELVKQEYPNSLEEAFISSSDTLFRMDDIIELEKTIKDPILVKNGVKIYKAPITGEKYFVGVDSSNGEGGDEACISVWCEKTGEQVAELYGQFEPRILATYAANIGQYFNQALIIPERNSMGIATVNELLDIYPNDKIFRQFERDYTQVGINKRAKYGWATTKESRAIMLNDFRTAIEESRAKPNSLRLISQMKTFVNKDGKYEAETGAHDDCVMAAMMAWQGYRYIK